MCLHDTAAKRAVRLQFPFVLTWQGFIYVIFDFDVFAHCSVVFRIGYFPVHHLDASKNTGILKI